MNDPYLAAQLEPVVRRQQRLRLLARLTVWWGLMAVAGLGFLLLQKYTGGHPAFLVRGLMVSALIGAGSLWLFTRRAKPDLRQTAACIERRFPELRALLLTATQQQSPAGQPFNYLQQRVLDAARDHGKRQDWREAIAPRRMGVAHVAHLAALGLFLATLPGLRAPQLHDNSEVIAKPGVFVTPGDTQIEKGQSLVVMARFTGPPPPTVQLALSPALPGGARLPLVKNLADPVFGGTVAEVASNFTYHIEYAGERTRDFNVTVFEFPRLERADASLTYPSYTGLPGKRLENTRRITAVEGSQLDLALQFNKPVASARLVAKGQSPIPLRVEPRRATAQLQQFPLRASQTYDLQLADAEGRTNKVPARFVVEVQPNRPAQIRLAAPRGDIRPSPIEELRFEGEVWDDFGVQAFGLAYTVAGQETKLVGLGRALPAGQRRAWQHLLPLEALGAQPDQLIAYYAWADDVGPDGQIRRKTTDMFFAEVRAFDEIYRQGQPQEGPSGDSPPSGEGEQGQGNPTARLAELQKQIISATWKLLQEHGSNAPPQYLKDILVVRDSQAQAIAQAEAAQERTGSLRHKALWDAVTRAMEQALTQLRAATNSPAPLAQALSAEQAAYQALMKLQAREYEVARNRNRSRGQGQGQQQAQRQPQLDQLELTESESRYEQQRQAAPALSPERRESMQVLNRLQELARRQQDLNERLKELQTALQEAQTEAEREEIQRRLKRLREDEQQMLADLDELRQRMERGENQSRMAEERRRVDQARDQAQNAAKALDQNAVSQALASGTRAQSELQQARDDLRNQNAGQFAEDMRQMRADARDLARRQEELARDLQSLNDQARRTLSDTAERTALQTALAGQRQRLTNLLDQAAQVSQQSESTEPLLSKKLYDTLRQVNQEEARNLTETKSELVRQGRLTRALYDQLNQAEAEPNGASLRIAEEMVRQGLLPQATRSEQRARAGINELLDGLERAAESVLGDEAEALRLAEKQLDELAQAVRQEAARAEQTAGAAQSSSNAPVASALASQSADRSASNAPTASAPQARSGQGPSDRTSAQTNRLASAGTQPGEGNQARQASRSAEPATQPGQRDTGPQASANAGGPGQRPSNTPPNLDGRAQGGARTNDFGPWERLGGLNRNGGTDGGNRRTTGGEWLDAGGAFRSGPITGHDFGDWSDRLREVEELLDQPDLRNEIATARERARQMRMEFTRNLKKPDWAVVRLQVVKPLVEVRRRVNEELARREAREALAPVDRDPVPSRYSELVRRYYEELGKDTPPPAGRSGGRE
jgi:hypothetical protein